jgi:type I restriction enzyme S subunit
MVLFGKLNPRVEKVWKVGPASQWRQIGSTEWLAVLATDNVDPSYIYYLMWSDWVMPRAKTIVSGSTPSRQRVDPTAFYGIEVPLPPMLQQGAIVSLLDEVSALHDNHERLVVMTEHLRASVIHQLFTTGIDGGPTANSEVGEVPESWTTAPLGDYLVMAQYGTSAKGASAGLLPSLRMTNQRNGRVVIDDLQYVDLSPDDANRLLLEEGDILFNRTNSHELVGRTVRFDLAGEYVFASYLVRLRTDGTRLRSAFLNHYMNWPETQARLKTIAQRSVSQSNISAGRLKGFVVPVPPLEVQDRIVTILDWIELKLASHRALTRLASELRSVLLGQLTSGELSLAPVLTPSCEEVVTSG